MCSATFEDPYLQKHMNSKLTLRGLTYALIT